MAILFTKTGQLHLRHIFGEKTEFYFMHVKFEMPVWHLCRKSKGRYRERQTDICIIFLYLYVEFHGKVWIETEIMRVSIIQTVFKPVSIHPYLSNCGIPSRPSKPSSDVIAQEVFPDHPRLIPFSSLLLGYLVRTSIFPPNTL